MIEFIFSGLFYFILCLVIGISGRDRKIGFATAFFISLLLTPLIGLIFTLNSSNKVDELMKKNMLKIQNEKLEESKKQKSVLDDISKLVELKEKGVLSEEEFISAKKKLLA